jgi:hypothetical protein
VRHDAHSFFIDRYQAFGMGLTQRHMQGHLLFMDRLQAIDGESDAFAYTDSGGPHEAESIGLQGVGKTELLLQALIVLQRKRSWQIVVAWGKVLATNEVGLQEMPLVGQVAQHTPELDETRLANHIAERRMLLAEEAEPA